MKKVPNPELDQEKISMRFIGLLDGIPVNRSLLATAAMRQIYLRRTQIVDDIALKGEPGYIGEARDLVRALVIIEQLLSDAGVQTDRETFPSGRETWLQVVENVFGGEREAMNDTYREVLAKFNKSPVGAR